MEPRYETTLCFSSPFVGGPEFMLSLNEETMAFSIRLMEGRHRLIPPELEQWDAAEEQFPFARKIVAWLYDGVETSQEVSDAETERLQEILETLANTALPDE